MGLMLSLVLVVISLSGSALVFRTEIDRWLNPDLLRVEPRGERVSMGTALARVEAAAPESAVRLVRLPRRPDHPVQVWLTDDRHAFVDPYSGEVLGVRGDEEGAMNTLFALHAELLAGTTGAWVVGAVGLLTLLLAATGVVLWWPAMPSASRLRKALAIDWRRGPWRLNYDVHRAGGFYTAVFLVLVAATGSALVFYDATGAFLNAVTAASAPLPPPTVGADEGRLAPAVLDAALETARRGLPDAVVTFLTLPQTDGAPVTVRMRAPTEWHPNGRSYVYIAPASGRVLRIDDARTAPLGVRLLHGAYPLHIGAMGGGVVRVLYVLLGATPALLSVTGTLIWFRRWRRRHRRLKSPRNNGRQVVPEG